MNKQRLAYFDNLKGILIFLVVLGHFTQGRPDIFSLTVRYYIYLFHMPLFIFVSGLFAKSSFRNGKLDVSKVFYYLLLGMLFSYSMLIFDRFVFSVQVDPLQTNPFSTTDIPWYLIALGVYTALTPLFARFKPSFAIISSVVFSLLINHFSIPNFFSLQKCIIDLPFFLLGFYVKSDDVVHFVDKIKRNKHLIVLLGVCSLIPLGVLAFIPNTGQLVYCYTTACFGDYKTLFDLSNMGHHYSLVFAILLRIVWYAVAVVISVFFMCIIPKHKISLLTRIGKNSLSVYIYHLFVTRVLIYSGFSMSLLPNHQILYFIVMTLLSLIFSIILGVPDFLQKPFLWLKKFCDFVMEKGSVA